MNSSSDEVANESSEKWVRAVNWKASISAVIATIAFVLTLDAGPNCNFVVLRSPLLQQEQHFGLWYFLTTERVPPAFNLQDVCRLYQSTADLGGMWEASRTLWFLSIIPGFILTCTLWRMLITPVSKMTWGFLLTTCTLCCFLEVMIICLFLFGHACWGNQMMAQASTSCTLATGSYVVISAAIMWFITLLTMGYCPPYIKQTDPKIDEDMGISVSAARNNGLIELQVCERGIHNRSYDMSDTVNINAVTATPNLLDFEMAKTEVAKSVSSSNSKLSIGGQQQDSSPPEIDESDLFNLYSKKKVIEAVDCGSSVASDTGKAPSHNDKDEEQVESGAGDKNSPSQADKWKNAESASGLDVDTVTDLENRFA